MAAVLPHAVLMSFYKFSDCSAQIYRRGPIFALLVFSSNVHESSALIFRLQFASTYILVYSNEFDVGMSEVSISE
jgi:hypothetical protein